MGDSMQIISIVFAILFCISFGFSQETFAITTEEINEKLKIDDVTTRPTFGLSHDSDKKIVDSGFTFNNQTFAITNNFHTPFPKLPVALGEVNTFEAKVFAENDLMVQEFLFGIPQKGDAHLAELGIEVWFGILGEVQEIKVIQKSNVIDIESIIATHKKEKCMSKDTETNCDATTISMIFLEPLQYDVMAIKAIDSKKRYHITYLNDGFDISGDSLNPLETIMIPSNQKGEGLIQVTQTAKYSPFWSSEDGKMFKMNSFGSFTEINKSFERFQDSGDARKRVHSDFGKLLKYEQEKATDVFDASKLISELPESFSFQYKDSVERITPELKAKMFEIEQECLKDLIDSKVQARW